MMVEDASDGPAQEHDNERKRKLQELQEQFEKGKKDKPEQPNPFKSM